MKKLLVTYLAITVICSLLGLFLSFHVQLGGIDSFNALIAPILGPFSYFLNPNSSLKGQISTFLLLSLIIQPIILIILLKAHQHFYKKESPSKHSILLLEVLVLL